MSEPDQGVNIGDRIATAFATQLDATGWDQLGEALAFTLCGQAFLGSEKTERDRNNRISRPLP